MPLPLVEEVQAARSRHAEASAAHQLVHGINEALHALEHWNESRALPGVDLLDGFEARWTPTVGETAALPPLVEPTTLDNHTERLEAAQAALLDLAKSEHELEHELETLLYDQYQALSTDEQYAEQRAILEPLYEERAALYVELVPKAERHVLIEAGLQMLESYSQYMRDSAEAHDPSDDTAMAERTTLAMAEGALDTLVNTLCSFGLEGPYPQQPEVKHDDSEATGQQIRDAVEQLAGDLERYRTDRQAACEALGLEVETEHARWNEINRIVHSFTG